MAAVSLAELVQELRELLSAIDIDTNREYDIQEARGLPLRQALQTSSGKLSHEMTRFTIAVRSTGDDSAIPGLVGEIAAASAAFVSAIQLLTKPGSCGTTLTADTRGLAKSCVRSVVAALSLLLEGQEQGSLTLAVRKHANEMLYHAGMVIKACDAVTKLPVTDQASVKRRCLNTAKLVKSSAVEIAEDHGLQLDTLTAPDPAVNGAAQGAPGASKDDSDDEDDEDEDTFDEDDESGLSPSVKRAVLTSSLLSLKGLMRVLKHAISVVDAVAALPRPAAAAASDGLAPALASAHSVESLASALASTSLSSGTLGALPPTVVAMDAVADAVHVLHDAVIDAAAAINEVGLDDLRQARGPLSAAIEGVWAAAQRCSALAAGTSQALAVEAALGEIQSGKEAALSHLAGALRAAGVAT